ncbi:MAG: hypothetical protein HFI43_10960 [Lachnospiraceae bacterium]|jgi:hypothetical protein|nr:hypothetical protein [Lachnospiraceae bacterium]
MKCPDCGYEITEGYLYCEKCGREIQIVPVFEPEIENSITETLSTVAEEIEGNSSLKEEKKPEAENVPREPAPAGNGKGRKKKSSVLYGGGGKSYLLPSLTTFIAVTIAAAFAVVYLYHRYSVNYQIEQARYYAQMEDYEKAVEYLENARQLKADSAEIVLMESNYYYHMGDKQEAADLLLRLLGRGQLTDEEKARVYESLITIYDEEARYEEINALLIGCGDDTIINHYQQYMAMEPEFGYISGSYDEVITLKISANTTGNIYYTLDGSEPDTASQVYTAPLFLETGEYQVAAVFVNEYGIKSETARNWYVINLTAPDPPELLLYSGEFHQPTKIEVVVPEGGTVYYTMDGSDPSADSLKYTEPVAMPLGRTNFKFVTISDEGVASDVVSRSFNFTLETDITVQSAINSVVTALYNREVLTDLQGHSHGIMGKYVFKYNTIVEIPNLGYYYILNEYIESETGVQTKTEHLYAVEVYTGAPNRLIFDENGQPGLISLQ